MGKDTAMSEASEGTSLGPDWSKERLAVTVGRVHILVNNPRTGILHPRCRTKSLWHGISQSRAVELGYKLCVQCSREGVKDEKQHEALCTQEEKATGLA